ncbi:MAG: hypothetical protein J6B86_06910 [Clostridia bacterium]|nr:hypothetical protein [Clostridia bacterium]
MKKSRIAILSVAFAAVLILFVVRLVKLQLIDGDYYRTQSLERVVTKTVEESARGEILDRYGLPLVQNKTVLSVNLDLNICKDVNGTISAMISVFDSYKQEYTDLLPISDSEPYIYTEETLPKEFYNFLEKRKISTSATAETVISGLISYYKLEEYSPIMARAIIGVRYSMFRSGSPSIYPFASGVSVEIITALKERDEMIGVEISTGYSRSYTEENFASHILGYIGPISANEYETRKDQGYALTDTVGKDGIEKICEDVLRGKDGYRYIEVNSAGAVTSELEGEKAQFGSDVILTIGKNMQQITEESLASAVEGAKKLNGEESATAAAAVFMEIETGEILSMASNPDYNLATFYEDYAELSQSSSSPYVNRAVSGAFPPGSTWKIVTAIAGLEEGIITKNTTYRCTGRYTYYSDYQPTCYESNVHGVVNVESALQKSCNCFFYEVGRQLGSDKLAEYAALLGFGSKTGIELSGEISGSIASKTAREEAGGIWNGGENLMAAIGQSDNVVTPLQLTNLVATVAGNGVRTKPYLIRSITNRDTGETTETPSVQKETLQISEKTLQTVRNGMYKVVNEQGGTVYSYFRDFDIVSVAAKSGTAEYAKGHPTVLISGYAPANDPKIAFTVVIEHGGKGANAYTSQVVKDVLSYYFSNQDSFDSISDSNTLLP